MSNPKPDDTALLVERAKGGDPAAWQALYNRYRPQLTIAVHGRIPSTLRSRFETDDVLQSAFITAFNSLAKLEYEDEPHFRLWLRRVVINKLRDRIRWNASDKRNAPTSNANQNHIEDPSPNAMTPSEIVGRAERQAFLLEAVAQLPAEDQDIVWLRFFERRAWSEIALELGSTERTIRTRYTRLLGKLMDDLK